MEREQIISVMPEMTETLISVSLSVETEETLVTVSEIKYPIQAEYEGETEITPTQETQTLHTSGLLMPVDIVINPIPSNYGLISWSGRGILVS